MTDRASPEDPGEIRLGHLEHDISFVTRILRAHILGRNAPLYETHGVAGGAVALLNVIGLNPGVSQKDISRFIVLKKPALTKLLNEMARQGLIVRRKHAGDRRLTTLHLTAKGEQTMARMRPDMAALQDRMLAALSPAEKAMLFELLWRLIDSYGAIEEAGLPPEA